MTSPRRMGEESGLSTSGSTGVRIKGKEDDQGGPLGAGAPLPHRFQEGWESSGWLLGEERERLQLRNLEGLATADVGTGELVVASHHVRLRLGEAGTVTLVGPSGQLGAFTAHHPRNFVFGCLTALGADEGMGPQFCGFVKKIPFFHYSPRALFFQFGSIYSILVFWTEERQGREETKTRDVFSREGCEGQRPGAGGPAEAGARAFHRAADGTSREAQGQARGADQE